MNELGVRHALRNFLCTECEWESSSGFLVYDVSEGRLSGIFLNGIRVVQTLQDFCGKTIVEKCLRFLVARREIGAGSSEFFVYKLRVCQVLRDFPWTK